MPHAQKFQHPTRVFIHQLAPLVVHVLGLLGRWGEFGSRAFARYPFFHEQQVVRIQSEKNRLYERQFPKVQGEESQPPVSGMGLDGWSSNAPLASQEEKSIFAKNQGKI